MEFGKINLAAMPSHAIMKTKDGQECIILPIKKNNMFLSEKGNVYLDLIAFERKTPQTDKDGAITQTHLVKQSLPKAVREAQTEQEKMDQPIIGSLTILGGGQNIEKPSVPDPGLAADMSGDDLPF